MYVQLSRLGVVVLGSVIVVGCSTEGSSTSTRAADRPATLANPQQVNADAQLLADFKSRIDSYMALHNRLEKQAPPLKETKDPAQIKASQDVLGAEDSRGPQGRQAGRDLHARDPSVVPPADVPGNEGAGRCGNQGGDCRGEAGAQGRQDQGERGISRRTKAAIAEEKQELKDVKLRVNAAYPTTLRS